MSKSSYIPWVRDTEDKGLDLQYARSARKWGIQPTKMSTFFVKKKSLHQKRTRKGMFSSLMGGGDAEVPAENVQNGMFPYLKMLISASSYARSLT